MSIISMESLTLASRRTFLVSNSKTLPSLNKFTWTCSSCLRLAPTNTSSTPVVWQVCGPKLKLQWLRCWRWSRTSIFQDILCRWGAVYEIITNNGLQCSQVDHEDMQGQGIAVARSPPLDTLGWVSYCPMSNQVFALLSGSQHTSHPPLQYHSSDFSWTCSGLQYHNGGIDHVSCRVTWEAAWRTQTDVGLSWTN